MLRRWDWTHGWGHSCLAAPVTVGLTCRSQAIDVELPCSYIVAQGSRPRRMLDAIGPRAVEGQTP